MKIDGVKIPKSSFLSMEKDMGIIVNKICENERLKRLLYYTSPDAIDRPNLTDDQMYELFKKNIRIIPKLTIDGTVRNYLIISFDDFSQNNTNPEFRDNVLEIDIVCHFDQWPLKDFQLRPYRIAAELDSMLDKTHLTGSGELEFEGANQILLTDDYAGLCLSYRAIHGEEDKKKMPNPIDDEKFLKDFKEMYNK